MRILGIDPGTATTGFGVIEASRGGEAKLVDAGVISTPAGQPMPRRLQTLHEELAVIIAASRPEAAAIELLYFSKNVTTGISVAQARGVALLALAEAGLEPGEYNPMQVKQAVTGYGSAKKSQVQEMVRRLLGLATIPKPDDAADALAIALTHGRFI